MAFTPLTLTVDLHKAFLLVYPPLEGNASYSHIREISIQESVPSPQSWMVPNLRAGVNDKSFQNRLATTLLPPSRVYRDLGSKLDRSSNFCLDEGSEVSAFATALNQNVK